MNPNSLVSIDDLSEEDILAILEDARFFEENPNHRLERRSTAWADV